MSMQEHTLIHDIGRVLKWTQEHWYLIGGFFATLWGGALMVKKNWLGGYATKQEMQECHNELHCLIQKNRELNSKEHTELRKDNSEILKILLSRVDK